MVTIKEANEIAQKVGQKYNYTQVDVTFEAHRDFKVTWQRSYRVIAFQLSDYLKGASNKAIESLFEVMFSKILRIEGASYNDAFKNYVTSAKFIEKNREKFLKRHEDVISLEDREERDGYLILRTRLESYCSPMFKVIFVEDGVDVDDVFDEQVAICKENMRNFE